jgi:hypothetical protein
VSVQRPAKHPAQQNLAEVGGTLPHIPLLLGKVVGPSFVEFRLWTADPANVVNLFRVERELFVHSRERYVDRSNNVAASNTGC